jgi:D-amino-acid dehydrogenase
MRTTGTSDVLIVGGGAIGMCCAWYLRASGASVTLLEAAAVGSREAASYGNIGMLVPSALRPVATRKALSNGLRWLLNPASPLYIRPSVSPQRLRWLLGFRHAALHHDADAVARFHLALIRASLQEYRALAEGGGFELRTNGSLFLYNTEAAFAAVDAEVATAKGHGVKMRKLSAGECRDIEPLTADTVVGGLACDEDANLDPNRFVIELARRCVAAGVRIVNGAAVERLEYAGGRAAAAHSSAGRFAADSVVLASGAWLGRIAATAGVRMPIEPAKGYSVTGVHASSRLAVQLHLAEARTVMAPIGEAVRLGGTLELGGFDRSVNQRRLESVLGSVSGYLRGFDPFPVDEVWAGYRPLTADTMPIIGRAPRVENLLLAGGHGMLGMSMAPATGGIVADLVAGKTPPFDLALARPDR